MSLWRSLLARAPQCPFGADDVASVTLIQPARAPAGARVERIHLHDGARFILKSGCESSEVRATLLAARLGVAPPTWPIGEGAFLQSFLPGPALARRWRAGVSAPALGRAAAGLLRTLHEAGLCYIDSPVHHLHQDLQGHWRLIDYGTALVLDDARGPHAEVGAWLRRSSQSQVHAAGPQAPLGDLARLHDWLACRDALRDARRPLMWPAARRACAAAFEAAYPRHA